MKNQQFAGLLVAKLFHDLATPLNTAMISIENGDPIVKNCFERLVAIFNFFRGLYSWPKELSLLEAKDLLTDFLQSKQLLLSCGNLEGLDPDVFLHLNFVLSEQADKKGVVYWEKVSQLPQNLNWVLPLNGNLQLIYKVSCARKKSFSSGFVEKFDQAIDSRNFIYHFLKIILLEKGFSLAGQEDQDLVLFLVKSF